MREIPLTQGFVAIVDDEDYPVLSRVRWCATRVRDKVYAKRVAADMTKPGSRQVYMHRQIMGDPIGLLVNHRDDDGLNNRRPNLRVTDRSGNQQSARAIGGGSTFKGVSWHGIGRKWQAHIKARGERRYLGLFVDEVAAAQAYDVAARELHGEFARLNFPTSEALS